MAAAHRHGRGRGRYRRNRDALPENDQGKRVKKDAADVDENSIVIQAFRTFQQELDTRNDRHERIVKLSRDITIESKRLIFLLQRVTGTEDKDTLLKEAAEKIKDLNSTKFLAVAEELDGQDPFQFLRAFSPGLQEYIEAVTFYHYLTDNKLISLDKIQAQLKFTVPLQSKGSGQSAKSTNTAETGVGKGDNISGVEETNLKSAVTPDSETDSESVSQHAESEAKQVSNSQPEGNTLPHSEELVSSTSDLPCSDSQVTCPKETCRTISVPIPPSEYILGVADFTGELMRTAINSVGAGDLDTPAVVAEMMRIVYDAFSTLGHPSRELRQKTRVLRDSLKKVETACYTLKVRGAEIPKHLLADVFTSDTMALGDMDNRDEAEGLY